VHETALSMLGAVNLDISVQRFDKECFAGGKVTSCAPLRVKFLHRQIDDRLDFVY